MANLFDSNSSWKILEKAMDVSSERHRLITNNIANIDTIGYKPKDLDFHQALQEALDDHPDPLVRTHPKHMRRNPVSRVLRSEDDISGSAPVNIDREMTHLVENNLKYRTSIEMLLRKMNLLKHSITEGAR